MNYRHYLTSASSLMLTILFAFSITSATFAADAENGKKIFKAKCSACHKATDGRLVGPGLKGVLDRVPSKDWLYEWVKDSKKVIDSGDEYAVGIFNEYKSQMTAFPELTNEEIDDIFEFVENPPVVEGEVIAASGGSEGNASADNSFLWLVIVAIVLVILLKILIGLRHSLRNILLVRDGKPEVPESGMFESLKIWVNQNKKFTAIIVLICVLGFARQGYDVLKGVGVYTGYAPEQPIKFSHKIHAGDNGIDCVYCHHSAEKGKTSGIPSVNVCMNCHKAISEGKRWGTEEISKIYAAAGYNTETGAYDLPQKPIKWIKIHNLPDYVYFNHSQHVVVGKQKCQTCHGEVQEFDYPMHQENDLTMGWCINCHRETGVDIKNPYYEKMHAEFKEKYAGEDGKTFNVEAIGGLECAKCHY